MLRLPNSTRTVHAHLAEHGPMTLSLLASQTGLTQSRLRTHVRSHRDCYENYSVEYQGIKLRYWEAIHP